MELATPSAYVGRLLATYLGALVWSGVYWELNLTPWAWWLLGAYALWPHLAWFCETYCKTYSPWMSFYFDGLLIGFLTGLGAFHPLAALLGFSLFVINLLSLSGTTHLIYALFLWTLGALWGAELQGWQFIWQTSTFTLWLSLPLALAYPFYVGNLNYSLNLQTQTHFKEQALLYQELDAAIKDAEAALTLEQELRQQQREFFAILSHEIRTPLSVLVMALPALSKKIPEEHKRLHRMQAAVERIQRAVDGFYVDDRANALTNPRTEIFNIQELQARIEQQLASVPQAEQVCWMLTAEQTLIQGQLTLLEVALRNLIENALKYGPQGARVLVHGQRQQNHYLFNVVDEGELLQEKESLFMRYVRGRKSQKISGTGLGLYMARRIARSHGGDIKINDQAIPALGETSPIQTQGNCFSLTLPCLT
ncbi:MASE2 domain-containing protein [Allopseudospirillum japonicum]|uniref:histidine kinase n=1 Tax=Allopseudospirillum japonicum TaxID=64971 RepID=A0A1H6R9H2_9GAMM|nr:ATP-binding protein [Allopseudospirillum japonicum]SEI52518.1 MASE2 domain-containing protein [Allopseudospirillum japonicum]